MAKLNDGFINAATPSQRVPQQETTVLELASLGLFFCMVAALVGIKIWWFKHRLTFDHSSSTKNNAMASGSQSYVMSSARAKNRSSKDKRISQLFREPVMIHGVFRKRHEDDLDGVERPKLLPPEDAPPNRSPLLFHGPPKTNNNSSRQHEIMIANHLRKIPVPPLRDPPTPPIAHDLSTHPFYYEGLTTPAGFHFPGPPSRNPPAPPPFHDNSTPLTQSLSTCTPIDEECIEVKPIIMSAESQLKIDPITHQIKSKEHAQGPDEFDYHPELITNKDYKLTFKNEYFETPTGPKPKKPLRKNKTESTFSKAGTAVMNFKPDIAIIKEQATGYERPNELEWPKENYQEHREEKKNPLRKWKDLQSYNSEDYDNDEEETMDQRVKYFQRKHCVVKVQDELKVESDDNEKDKENEVWQEMEQEIQADFRGNVEEEFNKIGKLYKTNEKSFPNVDTGYGKTIEEDWENFEKLANEKDKSYPTERRPTGYVSRREIEQRQVHFKLNETDTDTDEDDEFPDRATKINARRPTGCVRRKDLKALNFKLNHSDNNDNYGEDGEDENEDEDDKNDNKEHVEFRKSSKLKQRRPTGFVGNSEEIIDQLMKSVKSEEISSSSRSHTTKPKVSFQLDNDKLSESENKKPSILRNRRPTGFGKPEEDDLSTLIKLENQKEDQADFKRISKPYQKVTFKSCSSSSDEAEAGSKEIAEKYEGAYGVLLNRSMAKIMYKKTTESMKVAETTATTDSKKTSCYSDSWSAIQKHRQLTEEFQKIDIREYCDADILGPSQFHRNPLANLAKTAVGQTNGDTNEPRQIPKTQPKDLLLEHRDFDTSEV